MFQEVAVLTVNQVVAGSSPAGGATKKERLCVPFFVLSTWFDRDPAAAKPRQVGAGRTRERSQCEIKRPSEGAAVEGFKTALRVAEASGTANGRTNTALPVADEAVLVRALKKGEIEQNPFCEDIDYFSIAELQLLPI